jgi:hypothetical protein
MREASSSGKKGRRRREHPLGGDDDIRSEFDQGVKLFKTSPSGRCYAAFFLGSKRGKIAVPDYAATDQRHRFLRGLEWRDIKDLHSALGDLIKTVRREVLGEEEDLSRGIMEYVVQEETAEGNEEMEELDGVS